MSWKQRLYQAEQGEADLQRQKDRIYRKEIDLRELTQRQKDAQDGVRLALRELQDGNGVLELGQEHEGDPHRAAAAAEADRPGPAGPGPRRPGQEAL